MRIFHVPVQFIRSLSGRGAGPPNHLNYSSGCPAQASLGRGFFPVEDEIFLPRFFNRKLQPGAPSFAYFAKGGYDDGIHNG